MLQQILLSQHHLPQALCPQQQLPQEHLQRVQVDCLLHLQLQVQMSPTGSKQESSVPNHKSVNQILALITSANAEETLTAIQTRYAMLQEMEQKLMSLHVWKYPSQLESIVYCQVNARRVAVLLHSVNAEWTLIAPVQKCA